jgi:hypothetical protein
MLLGHENLSSTERYVHGNISMAAPLVEDRWAILNRQQAKETSTSQP